MNKEMQILKAYYDKKYLNKKIDESAFALKDGKHEGAFYLSNLERKGFVEFVGEVIPEGGQTHPKYNNRVAAIWWSDAHITRAGEDELKQKGII